MRRNALGLARTVIESGFELDLRQLLFAAANWVYARIRQNEVKDRADLLLPLAKAGGSVGDFNQAFKGTFSQLLKENPDAAKQEVIKGLQLITQEIFDFILDRLRGYYADKGVPATHFNAVAALFSVAPEGAPTALGVGAHLGATHGSLYDFDRRIDAIGIFATLPEAEALAAANKRIRNILRKVEGEIPGDIDTTLLREPAEEALAEAVEAAIGDTGDALHRHDYVAVLARLARLRPQVDAFFDGVMVNADDPQLRANRLALLKKLGDRLGSVAAIEHLSS